MITKLENGGILRPQECIDIAEEHGLDLAAAATLLIKESSGGHNVWGHDPVDTCGNYSKGGIVNEPDYLAYKQDRERCGYQGVGPCQLTYYVFQDRADARGGCWKTGPNTSVGFELFADYYRRTGGIRESAGNYNGGPNWRQNPSAVRYADDFQQKYYAWQIRLGMRGEKMKTLADLEPSTSVTHWASSGYSSSGFVRTNIVALHESVGATDAIGLAEYCEQIGVSYNAITDLEGGGRIVYTVPRSKMAYHIPQGVNAYANGLCLTTPVEGYSRAEWLGAQRRKTEIAAWYWAVVGEAEELDLMLMSHQNIRDAVYGNNHLAGGCTTHRMCDQATNDPTPHTDPRNFPTDVAIKWAQEAAGYSNWQTRDPNEPKPQPEWPKNYTVQEGDTLAKIALMFDTSWEVIAATNDIIEPYTIYPGNVLMIPKPEEEFPKEPPKNEVVPWDQLTDPDFKAHYDSMPNEEAEYIGLPVTSVKTCPDGRGTFVRFQRAMDTPRWAHLYKNPNTGNVHEVYGAIMGKYSQLGWEKGVLGYPMTGESDAPEDSVYQRWNGFEYGWIGWSPETGAVTHYHDQKGTN